MAHGVPLGNAPRSPRACWKKGSHALVERELRSRQITREQTGQVTRLWAVQADSFRNLRPEKAGATAEVDICAADEPTVPGEIPVF